MEVEEIMMINEKSGKNEVKNYHFYISKIVKLSHPVYGFGYLSIF